MAARNIEVTMTPSHPSGFVRTEILEELGLTVTKTAEILGVRRATLSELLNGKTSLLLHIEKGFGVGMETLLRMQAWYDTSQMQARANEVTVQRYEPA